MPGGRYRQSDSESACGETRSGVDIDLSCRRIPVGGYVVLPANPAPAWASGYAAGRGRGPTIGRAVCGWRQTRRTIGDEADKRACFAVYG